MAKNAQIDIEINLTGQEEVSDKIEGVKNGAGEVGEAFSSMSKLVDSSNQAMADGLEGLGGGVGDMVGSVSELKNGFASMGKAGGGGFLALIGPIGGVLAAIYALYEAYKMLSGAAKLAEERTAAYEAASSDLTSKLEALTEKGVLPAKDALEAFIEATMTSQIAKEFAELKVAKLSKTWEGMKDAQEALTATQKSWNREIKNGTIEQVYFGYGARSLASAQEELEKKTKEHKDTVHKMKIAYQKVLAPLKDAAEQYVALEDLSEESLKTRAKEQIELTQTIGLLKAEIESTDALTLAKKTLNAETRAKMEMLNVEKMGIKLLGQFVGAQKLYIDSVNVMALTDQAAEKKKRDLVEAERKRLAEERANRAKNHRARLAQKRAMEMAHQKMDEAFALQVLSDQARLNELVIKNTQTGTEAEISLIEHRYSEAQRLAGDNHTQQLIAEEIYISELQSLDNKLIDQERAKNKKLEDLRKAEAQNVLNAQNKLQAQSDAIMSRAGDAAGAFGKSFAAAAADAIWTSKSIAESLKASMDALGRQATIEALMEGARALKDLAMSNFVGAAMHGKAAAAFLGVAGAAAITSAAVGGGGGGGGSSGGVSPLGSPLTDTAPQRDTAQQESPMIFNISMGTVYSTEQGALTALTNTITREINRDRRGSPRLRGT